MTCSSAQDSVMLYHEKRIKPLKSMALHRHINKCSSCKEFFLSMEAAMEIATETAATELKEPPAGFTESIMAKVAREGSITPIPPEKKGVKGTSPLAGLGAAPQGLGFMLLYALLLAAGLVAGEGAVGLVSGVSVVAWSTVDMMVAGLSGAVGVNVLILAVAMILTAVGIDIGKKFEA